MDLAKVVAAIDLDSMGLKWTTDVAPYKPGQTVSIDGQNLTIASNKIISDDDGGQYLAVQRNDEDYVIAYTLSDSGKLQAENVEPMEMMAQSYQR